MALGWSYWDSMGLIGNGLNLRIKHGDCWNSLNFQWSLKEGNDRTKWKNPGFRAIYGLGIGDTVAGWWLDDACGYFVVRVRNKDIKSSYALTKSISKKLCIPTFSRFELQGPAQFFKIGTTCWFNHPSIYQNCFFFPGLCLISRKNMLVLTHSILWMPKTPYFTWGELWNQG